MKTGPTILVSSCSPATIAHLQEVLGAWAGDICGVGLSANDVCEHLAASPSTVVVIDVGTQVTHAIECARKVGKKHPFAKVVVLGQTPDIGLVAKAILARASNYVVSDTPSDEWIAILQDAASSARPSSSSLFGRVRSQIPFRRDLSGTYCKLDGTVLTLADAAANCVALGLENDEIADHLGVAETDIASVRKGAEKGLERGGDSPLSEAMANLVGSGVRRTYGSARSSWKASAIAGLACLFLVAIVIFRGMFANTGFHEVTGRVTYEGKPLQNGFIRFSPEGSGSILAGEVSDGKYVLKHAHGSAGGTYKVTISGYSGVPGQDGPVMNPLGDKLFDDVTKQAFLPCADSLFDVTID